MLQLQFQGIKLKAKAPGGNVLFSSSDEAIAVVAPGGILKAKRPGTVTITARQQGNKFYNGAAVSQTIQVLPDATPLKPEQLIVVADAAREIKHVEEKDVVKTAVIYPNPVSNIASCQFYSTTTEVVSVLITNVSGIIVSSYRGQLLPGLNSIKIKATGLLPGIYYLQISHSSGITRAAFTKTGSE